MKELEQLKEIYAWSIAQDVRQLTRVLQESGNFPILVVGSGGAATVAHLTAGLHRSTFGMLSQAITPLALIAQLSYCPNYGVWCVSAGGENPDILTAARAAIYVEPRNVVFLSGRRESSLSKVSKVCEFVHSEPFEFPRPGDGFLATGSTLAFSVLVSRAFAALDPTAREFPKSIEELLEEPFDVSTILSGTSNGIRALADVRHLIVLSGAQLWPVAVDIESKFSETALSSVQIIDYRNFAHGRHYWLAKRPTDTCVVALIAPQERVLANRTLSLLPSDVSKTIISVPNHEPTSLLRALIESFFLVGAIGAVQGMDPGRPGVPQFGRDIYNLRSIGKYRPGFTSRPTRKQIAIGRKKSAMSSMRFRQEFNVAYGQAYDSFRAKLIRARIGAIVFDYDGTLCRRQERFLSLGAEIAEELRRLLETGIQIGIATGRGKSVRVALQECLPVALWRNVTVGYYNGSQCAPLDDGSAPDSSTTPSEQLGGIEERLRSNPFGTILHDVSVRKDQVTATTVDNILPGEAWSLASEQMENHQSGEIKVVSSGHSVDIIHRNTSKLSVVRIVNERVRPKGSEILCIGDMGRWPGNDYELLKQELSLSVDEVSWDLSSCWNIASAGSRGVQSCIEYLRLLKEAGNETVRFTGL